MTDLSPHNHDLMKLVKARVDANYPMTFIAQELGVHVDELCEWILKIYHEPRPQKQYLNKGAGALGEPHAGGDGWSLGEQSRRHSAWQRQRDGAAATRLMLEHLK